MAPAQIITVSGLPGSGTSTACGQLCTRLGWAYVDAGQIFRQLARESGLSLAEFGQRAEADARIDRQLDGRMVARAQAEAPIVLEGRLTGWMAHRHDLAAFKVWLAAAAEIRAQRVGDRRLSRRRMQWQRCARAKPPKPGAIWNTTTFPSAIWAFTIWWSIPSL